MKTTDLSDELQRSVSNFTAVCRRIKVEEIFDVPAHCLCPHILSLSILQRGETLPTAWIGRHEAEVIDHEVGRKSCIALVPVGVLAEPGITLRKRLNRKLRKFDPGGDH
jgi:hypothetical protein